jgi:hypothetical protein
MPTSHYFDQFTFSPEQRLLEDLTIEAIKIHGHDFIYMPRETLERDDVFGEDIRAKFSDNFMLEMYIETVDGFEGQQEILAKFGMQVVDTATLIVSKKRFEETIWNKERPLEGDLVFFPMTNGIFEINYVDHENPFYQLGKLHSYRLTIEMFTHTHEEFDTRKPGIDRISLDRSQESELDRSDNADIEEEKESVLDAFSSEEQIHIKREADSNFDEGNPFGEL